MHRDISEANMLMIPDPKSPIRGVTKRGILIDWDLCKFYDELMDGAKQSNRSVSGIIIYADSHVDSEYFREHGNSCPRCFS